MADEEFSFSGSWKLIEKQWPVSACVVGEPTRLRRVIAHKGLVRWRMSVEGLSAHGATPELGRNAVYDAARVVLALEEFARQLGAGEPHHLLGHTDSQRRPDHRWSICKYCSRSLCARS